MWSEKHGAHGEHNKNVFAVQKFAKTVLLELLQVQLKTTYITDTFALFEGLQKTSDLIKMNGSSNDSRSSGFTCIYLPMSFIWLYLLHGAKQRTVKTIIICVLLEDLTDSGMCIMTKRLEVELLISHLLQTFIFKYLFVYVAVLKISI